MKLISISVAAAINIKCKKLFKCFRKICEKEKLTHKFTSFFFILFFNGILLLHNNLKSLSIIPN